MEENKLEERKEGSEVKKGHCFGFMCHSGDSCGFKCHKIAKFCVIIFAALMLLGVGAIMGRHGDRSDRFDRSYRVGFQQKGTGCGAQDNFRGAQGNQENGFRGGRAMRRGNKTQIIDNGSQINLPADIQSGVQPAASQPAVIAPTQNQTVPVITSTPAKPATQAAPVK